MDPSFWNGKRVFVTGHTGFKGAWLCLLLSLFGAQVYGYARPPHTLPNLFRSARVGGGLRHSANGDVRDLEALSAAVAEADPEVVFHLAAQAIVRDSYSDPTDTFSTNVMGTANLLESVRRHPSARAVVIVTSDKCYENREWWWSYREKSALGGRDPYSASKACAELVTAAFRRSYFDAKTDSPVAVASVRAGNVIGGGDWSRDRLVPDTIQALTENRPVELRFPNAIRPWQHVLEPLSGYVMLAERLHGPDGADFAEGWNFAPPEEDAKSVGWLVEKLQRAWGVEPQWAPQGGPKPHEHIYLKLDASKARAKLGWNPRLRIEDTVAWVVDWYRAVHQGADAHDLCLASIERYRRLGAAPAPVAIPALEPELAELA